MEEKNFEKEFKLLLAAGDSKVSSMAAIEKAREFKFDEAKELLRKSEREMTEAHEVEKDLITEEARGINEDYGVLMMHAQDHLTTAIIFKDMAEEFLKLYEIVYTLKK